MKKIICICIFVIALTYGVLYASDETILIKDAPDYKLYYNNGSVAVVSNLKKDEALTRNLIINNKLIERYQVFLPLYIQIDADDSIARASLVRNADVVLTEKELPISGLNGKYEINIEQVVGIPDGVGMTAETIYQGLRVYKYQINWTKRDSVQRKTELEVVVLRQYEEDEYDYIYENMINKNYTNIYSKIMGMNNTELSVLETFLAAKYGVVWDVDYKLTQEMRDLNIAKINYTDLDSSHWAYNVIKDMSIKGILNGYEDGTFRPEDYIVRAEAAKILSKAFNISEINKKLIVDIDESHWAYNEIKKASLYIPMNGERFEPETRITRKDFVIAIMNLRGNNMQVEDNVFSDINGLSEDEIYKINLASKLGIINGYGDGTFRPDDALTRAEACAILSRAR